MRQNIVFLAFWISLVSGAAPIPGFRGGGKGPKDTPDTPDTPDPPSPGGRPNEEGPGGGGSPYYNPNDLYHGTPQGGAVNPNQVPTQAQLQSNNQVLEESLEVVHNALDAVQQIVDGFLKTPDAKSSTVEVEGPVLPSTWANPTTTTPQPLTFTPTTTLASTSFTACKSYASILFSCAATTSGFYSLQPTAQASCVCYATREATIPCNSGRGTQGAALPTLDKTRFDDAANHCLDFFKIQGYKNIADGLSNNGMNNTKLGAGFCNLVDMGLQEKKNVSTGLLSTLQPSRVSYCMQTGYPSNYVASQGPRISGFTLFDRVVVTTLLVSILVSSYALFS